MLETIAGILGFLIVVAGVGLGFWALRHQHRQYPKGRQIPSDEESKAKERSSAWMNLGGRM